MCAHSCKRHEPEKRDRSVFEAASAGSAEGSRRRMGAERNRRGEGRRAVDRRAGSKPERARIWKDADGAGAAGAVARERPKGRLGGDGIRFRRTLRAAILAGIFDLPPREIVREHEFDEQLSRLLGDLESGDKFTAAAEDLLSRLPRSGMPVGEGELVWELSMAPVNNRRGDSFLHLR